VIDMGTYTPNYGLYKPAIGEKGWGDKVNANFDTIDSVMHENRSQISRIKKDLLTVALNVMMNKALVHAETKDFYSIIADVITPEYPYGFKSTLEVPAVGVAFDNGGGGTWTKAIKIPLTTVPSEYAQYRIVIQSNTMQIYSADGTLKADYGAETGVASDFWNNVKSDGSDIRIADQDYSQLYFWIEEFDYSGKYAVIWVKIPANTTELYIAYGNPSATKSAYENGEQVFEFFDDFSTDTSANYNIAGTKYDGTSNASIVISGGIAEITLNGRGNAIAYVNKQVSDNFVIELNARVTNLGISNGAGIALRGSSEDICYYIYTGSGRELRLGKFTSDSFTELYFESWAIDTNWHHLKLIYSGGVFKLYRDGQLITTVNYTLSDSAYNIGLHANYNAGAESQFDNFKVLKLADPADFGDAEVITLTTTGDFITVTFDFPEGVDKLLITVDTDAQAIYYSTDDGQTWNPITPDEETPLPETAYSIKWKFEFATYVRGYAFITW